MQSSGRAVGEKRYHTSTVSSTMMQWSVEYGKMRDSSCGWARRLTAGQNGRGPCSGRHRPPPPVAPGPICRHLAVERLAVDVPHHLRVVVLRRDDPRLENGAGRVQQLQRGPRDRDRGCMACREQETCVRIHIECGMGVTVHGCHCIMFEVRMQNTFIIHDDSKDFDQIFVLLLLLPSPCPPTGFL